MSFMLQTKIKDNPNKPIKIPIFVKTRIRDQIKRSPQLLR
jgi:hypothetical protein